jgi:4-hydroxy-tetrahydrodipicolinate synthase
MKSMPIAGVAVWAHTGRGLYLSEGEREEVLMHWRESLPEGIVIAGAGCAAALSGDSAPTDQEYLSRARTIAEHAKSLGANAILCHPPTRFRNLSEHDAEEAIIAYHEEISHVGLPLILFYLYEAAGGIKYSGRVLSELFKLPNVLGIKIATLDSVMTFQDLTRSIRSMHPEMLIITGEDRFLGYSLMAGADTALVGMGSALTALQAEMMNAYFAQDFGDFQYRSQWVDQFSMATFREPMEGYISRMLYALAWQGIVSREAVFDPWGPQLDESEIDAVGDFLTVLPTELKH